MMTAMDLDNIERRGSPLCDGCHDVGDRDNLPTSPVTGALLDHHCDCTAVEVMATLLGAYSKTAHAEQCGGHGTSMDELYRNDGSSPKHRS